MPAPPHTTRSRGYLPHWESSNATYHVTFRLADALPQTILQSYLHERNEILNRATTLHRKLTPQEYDRLEELFSEKIERALDQGYGACHLRHPDIGQSVFDALQFFNQSRYHLYTWCVMPNHVHALFAPIIPHALDDILHSWKSFTARAANKTLGRTGTFWMPEYFDHLIRDTTGFFRAHRYILKNPTSANLSNWPWCATNVQISQ